MRHQMHTETYEIITVYTHEQHICAQAVPWLTKIGSERAISKIIQKIDVITHLFG